MSNKTDIHIILGMLFLLSFAKIAYAQEALPSDLSTIQADVNAASEAEAPIVNLEYTYPDANSFSGPNGIKEIQEKVYYNVLPSHPRLNDSVEIEAEMYGTPIKNATFIWSMNNKEVLRGAGAHKLNFVLEEKSKVSVQIITGEANIVTNTWNFNPKDTTIIWEAKTYTPPFYKGKSLYSPESTLVLNAIDLTAKNPLTNTYNNYVWKIEGEVKGDLSGVAKNTYVYKGDLLMQEPLFQVMTSPISTYNKQNNDVVDALASLRVQTLKTEIFTYESDPLLGVLFNKQIGSDYTLKDDEGGLVSYPLYFSVSSSLAAMYKWYANEGLVSQNSNSLYFKKTRSNEQSRLSVNIENPFSLLQTADISYIIDTTSNTNFFGFGQK